MVCSIQSKLCCLFRWGGGGGGGEGVANFMGRPDSDCVCPLISRIRQGSRGLQVRIGMFPIMLAVLNRDSTMGTIIPITYKEHPKVWSYSAHGHRWLAAWA